MKRPLEPPSETRNMKRSRTRVHREESSAASDDTICSRCKRMDLGDVMKYRQSTRHRFWIAALSHIDDNASCRLCAFFRAVRPTDWMTGEELSLVGTFAEVQFGLPEQFIESPVKSIIDNTKDKEPVECLLLAVARNLQEKDVVYFMDIVHSGSPFKATKIQAEVDYSYLRSIDQFCAEHHRGECERNIDLRLQQFRVIDCATNQLVTIDPLVIPFIALSYVWGQVADETASMDDRLPAQVPATIQDAMTVTLAMGYQYLWVDRYCVRQQHNSEKSKLIQSMDRIYSASAITIIAASGLSSAHGLPGVSRRRLSQPAIAFGDHEYVSIIDPRKDILNSRWNSRGWTYQEGLLAKRRLIFTDSQVYYQCPGLHCFESFDISLEPLHLNSKAGIRAATNMYRLHPTVGAGFLPQQRSNIRHNLHALSDRIKEYSARHMTYESDRLAAFEGIMSAFGQGKLAVPHLHGLPLTIWENEQGKGHPKHMSAELPIVSALLWRGVTRSVRRRMFPSWTWVGWVYVGTVADKASRGHEYIALEIPSSRWYPPEVLVDLAIVGYHDDERSVIPAGSGIASLKHFLEQSEPPMELRLSGWTAKLVIAESSQPHRLSGCADSADSGAGPESLHTVFGSPESFDFNVGRYLAEDSQAELICFVMLVRYPSGLYCLILEHKEDQRYERVGTARFESRAWTAHYANYLETASDRGLTWRQISLV